MAKLDLGILKFGVSKQQTIFILAGIAIAGYLIYRQGKKAVAGVIESVDPVSHENIFYKTFTRAYQGITGSGEDLGSDIYDLFHPKVESEPIVDPEIKAKQEGVEPSELDIALEYWID